MPANPSLYNYFCLRGKPFPFLSCHSEMVKDEQKKGNCEMIFNLKERGQLRAANERGEAQGFFLYCFVPSFRFRNEKIG